MAKGHLDKDEIEAFADATTTTESPLDLVSAATSASRVYVLRQLKGPGAPREVALSEDEVVIGRSRSADLMVESPELSRRHVKFQKHGNEYIVTDLQSRNGLYLDGVRIHSAVLRNGDTVQMGNVTFLYLEGF